MTRTWKKRYIKAIIGIISQKYSVNNGYYGSKIADSTFYMNFIGEICKDKNKMIWIIIVLCNSFNILNWGGMEQQIYEQIKRILSDARNKVYRTANFAMVEAYCNIGKSIVE